MKRYVYFILLLVGGVLFLVGCGGGGGNSQLSIPAEISGLVLDQGGSIVRDATVFLGGNITKSNSRGEFVLQNVTSPEVLLKAQTDQDGVDYYGEQVVELFSGERTKSANITVVRTSQLATVHGTVHSNMGVLLSGARVFFNAGTQTSTYAITDSNGNYRVSTLAGGLVYTVTVTGAGFDAGTDTVTPTAGGTSELDLVLTTATDPNLSPPTGLAAIAWTTPDSSIASFVTNHDAYEQIKRLIDPRRPTRTLIQPRLSGGGNPIEVDLTWTPVSDPGLLGYGVFRRPSGSGTPDTIDFLKDPLAKLYEDNDASLTESASYDYALNSVNSSDLNGSSHGESALSGFVTATTLGDLPVDAVTTGPLTFHWHAGSGATSFVVYVFDRYPSIGVNPIWTSPSSGGTSLAYGGPTLTSGADYFFIVAGSANSNSSFTLSPVLSFSAP